MWWLALATVILLALGAATLVYLVYAALPEDDRLFPFD